MQPHQQRVVDEKSELDAKILALSNFVSTSMTFVALNHKDQDLLTMQLHTMRDYSRTLGLRIERFDLMT